MAYYDTGDILTILQRNQNVTLNTIDDLITALEQIRANEYTYVTNINIVVGVLLFLFAILLLWVDNLEKRINAIVAYRGAPGTLTEPLIAKEVSV